MGKSEKNFVAALLLCLLLGGLGVHRFYVGKIGTGIL
jgi:TM2 domain-containing membrane protein YozV